MSSCTMLAADVTVMKRLDKNIMQEKCLLYLMGEMLGKKILALNQAAQVAVMAWPYMPDTCGLLHAIATLYRPAAAPDMPAALGPPTTGIPGCR